MQPAGEAVPQILQYMSCQRSELSMQTTTSADLLPTLTWLDGDFSSLHIPSQQCNAVQSWSGADGGASRHMIGDAVCVKLRHRVAAREESALPRVAVLYSVLV